MKTEQLEKLGLTEDQIKEIFKLNGQDIENYKTNNEVLEAENTALKNQLKTANEKIDGFKEIDVEQIKEEAENYKNDFEKLKEQSEKEISDLKLNHLIENSLIKSNAKNVKAIKALLDMEALNNSNNIETDLQNQINSLKKSDDYLFERKGQAISGSNQVDNPPNKNMTYSEMVDYLDKNPGAKI